MRYIYIVVVALCATTIVTPSRAQSAQDSVKAAVNLLFTGMIQSDAAKIRNSFTDSAILQSIVEKDGKTETRTESIEEFAQSISKLEKGVADERIRFDAIKIDGPLAIVWAPYSFYYKGQLNHCGVDSFHMLLVNGVWKIQYLVDTRRKQPCH
jgi:putative lumazine-binding protein